MPIVWRAVAVAFLALIVGVCPIVVSVSAVDAAGQVLVADPGAGSVRLYSADGTSADVFAGGLSSPSWIIVDRTGNIFVSEHDGQRISKFSPTGVPLLTFSTTYNGVTYHPGGVQVGADGTIYVADYFGGNVYRYSATGENPAPVASGLARADFMAFDAAGKLYVTDPLLGVVRCFGPGGVAPEDFVTGFLGLAGISFDAHGNLYVASSTSNIVQKYSSDPQSSPDECKAAVDKGTFASLELTDSIMGMAFDAAGNLYVANYAQGNVHRFSSAGVDLGVFASTGLVLPRDVAIVLGTAAPAVKEECKQDGWASFDSFNNQGDCIQYLNTGK